MVSLDKVFECLVYLSELCLVLDVLGRVTFYATVVASHGTHEVLKSLSGCTLHKGTSPGAFLSRSKKQTVTVDSSTVAEFIATHLACKEVM